MLLLLLLLLLLHILCTHGKKKPPQPCVCSCGYCFLGERLQLKLRGVFTKELYVSKLGMQRMYFDWEYYLYGMLGRMPHFR